MEIPHGSACDVFVKVGGSILDNIHHTAALAEMLVSLPKGQRIVILPGGGQVAKRIKLNQRSKVSDFQWSWRAATLALDVNAGLLASYSSQFEVSNCVAQIATAHALGKLPIFAPADSLFSSLWFSPNWIVTTDTMGLYFANLMGAKRYVIVTDVDGVCERAPLKDVSVAPIARLTVGDLERLPSSKLDDAFPAYFRRHPIMTLVVNGKHPNRVAAAVSGSRTLGTEILNEAEAPIDLLRSAASVS